MKKSILRTIALARSTQSQARFRPEFGAMRTFRATPRHPMPCKHVVYASGGSAPPADDEAVSLGGASCGDMAGGRRYYLIAT